MISSNRSEKYKDRNLSDVFKELQQMKSNPNLQKSYKKQNTSKKSNKVRQPQPMNFTYQPNKTRLKAPHIMVVVVILFILTTVLLTTNIFANSVIADYELNDNILDMQSIISQNADINKFKEQVVTQATVTFETKFNNNPSLPKGEQVVTQEGVLGKEKITSVRTYENQTLINEVILAKEILVKPTNRLVDVGTSEFLAKHKVHIGDTLYLLKNASLKDSSNKDANEVCTIKRSMDVKLLALPSENWCKVSFDNQEGYIESSCLTSATSTPEIVEENRAQRVLLDINIDMELNQSTHLTLDDYKKMLTGLSQDRLHIFEDNYQVFYNIDKDYHINGVFVAAIAIHESGWGSSTIANDKKNLFGYGAYDSSPYESSFSFDDYASGIETVAKALVKYYLNPAGTPIYDGEVAQGSYYVSPTLKGVNTRYASDPDWHQKVFNYMEMLYNRL